MIFFNVVRSEPRSHRMLYNLPHRSTEVGSKCRTRLYKTQLLFLLSSWLFAPPPLSLSFSPPQWITEAGLEVGQERVNNSSADCCLCLCRCCCCGGVNANNFARTHSDTRTHARTQSALLAHPTYSVLTSAGSGRPADRKVETDAEDAAAESPSSNEEK